MQIKIEQVAALREPEIHIRYRCMTNELDAILGFICDYQQSVPGLCFDREVLVKIYDILYLTSEGRKTLIHTKDGVYLSNKKLYQFSEMLSIFRFCQINKSCILNLQALEQVKSLYSNQLRAFVANGETLVVTRHYVKHLREMIQGGQ